MRHPHRFVLATVASFAILATACGTSEPSEAVTNDDNTVQVLDNVFDADHLEVVAGDTVTWIWDGSNPHDVVGDDFESEVIETGEFTHTFDEPGTYDYTCRLHGGMDGRITVVDA